MLGPPQDGRALPVSGWVAPYLLSWTWIILLCTPQCLISIFLLSAQQPTWTTCGSRPTGRPWSSGACRRPSAVSLLRMYLCPFQVFVSSPSIYFGLLQPAALLSRELRFPAFRTSHSSSSSSSSLSFLLLWFAFLSNSPLFCVFSSPSSSDTSSSRVISALCARTVSTRTPSACVCWRIMFTLAFSPRGSVECELPTSCYVCNTLLGVALQPAVLHTSATDDTKVFLKIGANSSGGRPRIDDSRALRLFSASLALTLSSRRFSPFSVFPSKEEVTIWVRS